MKSFEMKYLNIDLHIHSNISFDSLNNIEKIIEIAQRRNLDIIAITDHNSIDNALRAKELVYKRRLNVEVIVGEEISTDKGEVIGLFLENHVKPGKLQYVIENIKLQGGIVYLPHPFKRSKVLQNNMIGIDLIEVWNSRASYEQNYKALLYAVQHNILMGCGSDSHFLSEIGRCRMILAIPSALDLNLTADSFLSLLNSSYELEIIGTNKNYVIFECLSQVIKSIKTKKFSPYKYLLKFIPYEILFSKNNPDKMIISLEKLRTSGIFG